MRFREAGARFAKWRAALRISGQQGPSEAAVQRNAEQLAEYAAVCQACSHHCCGPRRMHRFLMCQESTWHSCHCMPHAHFGCRGCHNGRSLEASAGP